MAEKIRKKNGSNRNGEAGKVEQLTYLTKFIFVALKDNLVHSKKIYLFFYKKKLHGRSLLVRVASHKHQWLLLLLPYLIRWLEKRRCEHGWG